MEHDAGCTVDHYRDRQGRSPVGEFIDSLDATTRTKVLRNLTLLGRQGTRLGMPLVRPVVGYRFWELRVQAARNNIRDFYFTMSGHRILLLHAFAKKSQQTPRRELEIAASRLGEVMEQRS